MEVGRRSVGSNNEFPERRRMRKKTAALPLGVFLSFNDRDVHPECPNAINSYHKCGRHCFDKIPSRKNLLDALRSEGGQERDKKSEKKGINPICPNASNPYHNCAEYCFENLPEKRQDVAMKPKEKMKASFTTDRLVKPECKNASNPYHVCDEYCLESAKVRDQPRQVTRQQSSREIKKVVSNKERTGPSLLCKHASNPYHDCTVLCCQSVSERNLTEGAMKQKEVKKAGYATNRLVKPECKNSSNPYHVCDEYCLKNAPLRDQPGKAMWLKSLNEVKKLISNKERTGSPPLCKHASNPYHECTALCFQSGPVRNLAEGDNSKGVSTKTNKSSVRPSLEHASSSLHKVNECFFEDTPGNGHHLGADGIKNYMEGEELNNKETTDLDPKCKCASNPHHKCIKCSFQNVPDLKITEGDVDNPEGISITTDKTSVHHDPKHLSSPHHKVTEYCFEDNSHNTLEKKQLERAFMKSTVDNKAVVPLERGMNSQCKNASNPYHVCAEYCFQNVAKGYYHGRSLIKTMEDKKVVSSAQIVNWECKNASNPYHICAEYCFENGRERDHPAKTNLKSKEKERAVLPTETVNPDCKFASNPYHVCAEYCFENFPEREQRREAMKLQSLKHLKKLVSSKKITSGHPQCIYASNPYHECAEYCLTNSHALDRVMKTNERKKEDNKSVRRDVDPNCKCASNPSHRCTENCSEGIRISQKNEEVEGIKEPSREKKRNSLKKNKSNQLIMEKKSSMSSETRRIILRDRTEKNSTESEYTEALNHANNNFDLSYGTKDLLSTKVVEMKNLIEPIMVQPLHLIKASDLFHEWAKYCSQKKATEDVETAVQEKIVGLGELSTRNGKRNAFLKYYDSAKQGKVQTTGGIPNSLPFSLLFFLGLLFAVVQWNRVIHVLVMSSAKKNEGSERMKLKVDRDLTYINLSDPVMTG